MANHSETELLYEVLTVNIQLELGLRATSEGIELLTQPICYNAKKAESRNCTATLYSERFADQAKHPKLFARLVEIIENELPDALADMVVSFAVHEAAGGASAQTFQLPEDWKKLARSRIKRATKLSFDQRHKMPKSSNPELTEEDIGAQAIAAWDKLEQKDGVTESPTQEKLAEYWPTPKDTGISITMLKKHIKAYRVSVNEDLFSVTPCDIITPQTGPKVMQIRLGELKYAKPNYRTFLNTIRAKRKGCGKVFYDV